MGLVRFSVRLRWWRRNGVSSAGPVVARHGEECRCMIELFANVGIQDGVVTFPASPEDVVLPTELQRDIHHLFHRRHRAGEDMEVRIGPGTVHVAFVAEEVGGAPEELDPSLVLELEGMVTHRIEIIERLSPKIDMSHPLHR